jgi:predicted RNA-binding Zn-ribbon protein involved in translation (DUF1610 family)
MKLYCKNCQYSLDTENVPLACPFCGENKIERQKSAEELIEDLENKG